MAASADSRGRAGRMRRVDYARVVRKGGGRRTRAWSVFALGGVRGELVVGVPRSR